MPLPADTPTVSSLDLFVSVVHLGSLSSGAVAHGMSQPSASVRIRQLERQLGLQLLTRGPNGSVPTAAGSLVAEWAQPVLDSLEGMLTSTAALRSDDTSLRVAASFTIAEHLLPRRLGRLRRLHPDTTVELDVVNSTTVLERVRSGEVQLGFIESPGTTAGLQAKTVGCDELVVVVGPQHRWARRRRSLDGSDLAATPLVCREQGSGTRDSLEAALVGAGLEMSAPALELASTSAVRAAVESGAGPAVLSHLTVEDALAAGRLAQVPVDGVDLHRDLRAVWSRRRLDAPEKALLADQP